MGKMISVLGYTGDGNAFDKERGHDIVGSVSEQNAEWQKVSGVIPANSSTAIQFIWETPNCLPPTIQINGLGHAACSVKIYACNDRLMRMNADQDETQDLRPAHWTDISSGFSSWNGGIITSLGTRAAAAITTMLIAPSGALLLQVRPAWLKVVITPDGTVGTDDAIDVFTHATDK